MKTIKESYKSPSSEVFYFLCKEIITMSTIEVTKPYYEHTCWPDCILWHMCRDRQASKKCYDYKIKKTK